jgi:cyclic pyranopterin phosphate synthase
MPEEGVIPLSHQDILTYDEIFTIVQVAVGLGITKVRITGGEPLVRKGICSLIKMIASLPEITDLSMTTNGVLLETFAFELKESGLHRVNISLDTTDPLRYRELTRIGDVRFVLKGIDAALLAGLFPVKINCVIKDSPDEPDARLVGEYGERMGLEVRYIPQMDLGVGYFRGVIGGDGGNCATCNRLRLTSNGFVKPCLFSNAGYPVRELGPEVALQLALNNKPECGTFNTTGDFFNLGG